MLKRYASLIYITVFLLTIAITLLLLPGDGSMSVGSSTEYATRLFDQSRVHSLDLQVEDWQAFIAGAAGEGYSPCTAVIDGETFRRVGLRTKGNNSHRLTAEYGLSRYSLKLEFDHYSPGSSYYGLDKFTLDAAFQDNSYLKTYLVYDMMRYMEVPTPLCSFVSVTVNGSPWGLFLAIEEPEEAFARRCFGTDHGQLYKPDYRSLRRDNADVDLRYIGDDPGLYDNIFRNAKFLATTADKQRLVQSLKTLSTGENLETVVELDRVLRYFAVQVLVLNLDSYIGPTGHNYFLYEQEGRLSILPWDYNLAFGTYALGMTNPIRDPNVLINYPVNTPWRGEVMQNRPLFHQLMLQDDCFAQYRAYLQQLVQDYMDSGRCDALLTQTKNLIAPYVKADATAFCTYSDFELAVSTLQKVCRLRSESVKGQLAGRYPATLRRQAEQPDAGVDASQLQLRHLGDFEDLKNAKVRQDAALDAIP